ncbi:hypothetical protein ALC60_11478 [Trachymyrmex zeteki]|uniref:Uncharacterized protein n=1 Tax=Mycetomoellerius zeteki TaxID=64791 RepID=A0A151WNF5_9HYME|nr:hypothetical protein ALC60_11478 [Trachymyrmex zeteki]
MVPYNETLITEKFQVEVTIVFRTGHSKNPPFEIGIKTINPICLWQLNNQCAQAVQMKSSNVIKIRRMPPV